MFFYTTVGKTVTCSHWNKTITLSGKYRLSGNSDEAKFLHSTCPIVENSKLPLHSQITELELMRCPNESNHCELLDQFKKNINLNIDGYSQ